MKPLSSIPNHDDGENGTCDRIARGEGESAQRKSNDEQSSFPVPASTYSHLNHADSRSKSPGSPTYAVTSALPIIHATSAAYDDVKAPGDGQSPAKAAHRKTPSPSAEYAVTKAVVPGGAEIANDGRRPWTTKEHNTPSPSSPAQYAMVNKSGKNKKDEE